MPTNRCQLCESYDLRPIIDLGKHPLADTFLKPEQLLDAERFYTLKVLLCKNCGYATLEHIVPAEERYVENDYSYTSSNSPVATSHFEEIANEAADLAKISADDLAVDIGSNDGTLLEMVRRKTGCRVVGVEPSLNIARLAKEKGIQTIQHFFGAEAVNEILRHGKAKIITATNVYNHITDLNDFMKNINAILAEDGMFMFEAPYLLTLVEKNAFDTVYLEHVSYFGLKPLVKFFKKFDFSVCHVWKNDYMGGSVRAYVCRGRRESGRLKEFLLSEERAKIYEEATYEEFMRRTKSLKTQLMSDLYDAKARGEKIIGIGAATKGNTLLNYCGIDNTLLEFVTDSSPLKIGKFTPGSHLPIKSDDAITAEIKTAVILPWNIAGFLQEKLKDLNLKFIIPHI